MKIKLVILLVCVILVGCNNSSNNPEISFTERDELQEIIDNLTLELSLKSKEIQLLNDEVQSLEEENVILSDENYVLQQTNDQYVEEWVKLTEDEKSLIDYASSYISVFHLDVSDKEEYVYFSDDNEIKIGPIKYGPDVAIVRSGTLAYVLEKANVSHLDDSDTWFYIEIPNYAEPMNTRGWIRVAEVEIYTNVDINLVKNVALKENSVIHHCLDFDDIGDSEISVVQFIKRGWIEKRYEDYVFLTLPGGDYGWTKEVNLLIPDR